MGARVSETGGGANVGTSNAWNQFLNQQLQGMSNAAQPFQQTGNFMQGFGGALGGQGGFQDISGAGSAIQNFFGRQGMGFPGFGGGFSGGGFGGGVGGGGGGNTQFMTMGGAPSVFDARAISANPQGFQDMMQRARAQEASNPGSTMFGQPGGGLEAVGGPMGVGGGNMPVNMMAGSAGGVQGVPSQNPPGLPGQSANNPFTNPYQAPSLSQLPTNFGQGQTGMANLSQFGNAAQAGGTGMANLGGFGNAAQSNFNTQAPIQSGFDNMLMSMIQQGNQQQGISGYGGGASAGPEVTFAKGMDYSQAYNTLGQDPLMERNRQRAVAEQRARFGAEGAGSLGTGAQYAESNLNAELSAQDASQRRQQAMSLMGQDLQERMGAANVGLQGRGQNLQASIANASNAIQAAQNMNQFNNTRMANLLNAVGQGRGQDLSTGIQQLGLGAQQGQFNAGQSNAMQQAMMNAMLQNQGMGNQQSQFNAGQQNAMQQAMMNATLQNQGMGNQFGLGAQGLNLQAGQNNNLNALQNAQLAAQFGLGTNQLNAQNFQNMINQGLNMNQMGMQGNQFGLAQLFNSLNQANQLGTAQRNTTVTPNPWMQGLQILGQIAASAAGGRR